MLRKVANVLLISTTLGYIAGIATGHAVVYILCFIMWVAAILVRLLVLAIDLIWKLLPGDFKKSYEGKRGRFNAVIFFSVPLFYIVAGVIDRFCLPADSGFISLLAGTISFSFVVFLVWSLIRPNKGGITVSGSVVFILFIALLSFVSSLKSGEIEDVDSTEELKSLGYIDWVDAGDIEKAGVIRYEPESAFNGLNLYGSVTSQEAYLIDMHGNIVHKWAKEIKNCSSWEHGVEMCENGDLLVISQNRVFMRLDWDSNVKWKKRTLIHHDSCVDENERIHVLSREREVVFWHGIPIPMVYNDYIMVFSPDMEIMRKVYVYDMVKEYIPLHRIAKLYRAILWIFEPKNILRIFSEYKSHLLLGTDLLHLNSIEIMERDIEGFCKKGDWLISLRELDLVGIVDAKKEELVWSWGPGELDRQHHPTLLKNGNVLIFDNGLNRGFSRVVELNPLTRKIVWEYKSEPLEKFFSMVRGSNQRLPNGNTLIAESDKGRVFEITKEGRIVWDFYNPNVRMEDKKRVAIYRMMRIVDPQIHKLIEKRTGKTYY